MTHVLEEDSGSRVDLEEDSGSRGELEVRDHAVKRLVEAVIEQDVNEVSDASVRIDTLDDAGIDIEVDVTMAYPDGPLTAALGQVRRTIAAETEHLLGRPVRRVDLRIVRFATPSPARRPRVV